jgi:membrane-bound lytic murein transglycosylase A
MQDHISAAVPVFLKSCARFSARADVAPLDAMAMSVDFGRVGDWRSLCEAAEALPSGDDAAAREFFEKDFAPFAVADYGKAEGLFTGYYEIELNGSRQRRGRFQTPLYRKPPDLGPEPPTRAEIDDGALAGRGLELLWVDDPTDAFFLQIQGSGRVRLNGGGTGPGRLRRAERPSLCAGRAAADRTWGDPARQADDGGDQVVDEK